MTWQPASIIRNPRAKKIHHPPDSTGIVPTPKIAAKVWPSLPARTQWREAILSGRRFRGCWGYIGDEILPSYVGIIINHYIYISGSLLNSQDDSWKVRPFFFSNSSVRPRYKLYLSMSEVSEKNHVDSPRFFWRRKKVVSMMEKMADKIEGEADKEFPGSVNGCSQLIHG